MAALLVGAIADETVGLAFGAAVFFAVETNLLAVGAVLTEGRFAAVGAAFAVVVLTTACFAATLVAPLVAPMVLESVLVRTPFPAVVTDFLGEDDRFLAARTVFTYARFDALAVALRTVDAASEVVSSTSFNA